MVMIARPVLRSEGLISITPSCLDSGVSGVRGPPIQACGESERERVSESERERESEVQLIDGRQTWSSSHAAWAAAVLPQPVGPTRIAAFLVQIAFGFREVLYRGAHETGGVGGVNRELKPPDEKRGLTWSWSSESESSSSCPEVLRVAF